MTTEALDFPRGKPNFPVTSAGFATLRRLQVLVRHWRRQHSRQLRLAQVLAETSDHRLIEDAGFASPAPGIIDLWARTLLHQHQPHG